MTHITRRDLAMLATTALMARTALAQSNEAPSIMRAIPRTGERIPAVGLGTAYGYDRNDEQTRRAATLVGRTLVESGGQLIDTASTYGDAESVFGSVIANEGFRDKVFIATKLEAPDATELKRSLSRLRPRSSTCFNSTTYAIGGNHWHGSRRGRRKASAGTSV
jgi:aryl-alcohol dehydrogenase-like predicted oxidoreductase